MAPRNFASLARRILRPTQPSPLPKLPIPGTLNRVSLPSQTRECQKPGRFYSQTTLPNMVDVIVCDPRLLFAPFGDPLDPAFSDSVVGPFPIPRHLLQSGALSSPEEELDSYQPINSFYFGDRSEELFEYTFLGQHKTETDYSAVAVVSALDDLKATGLDWQAFKDLWRKSGKDKPGHDFCFPKFAHALPFAGNLESSYGLEGAAVHVLRRDGITTGLLVSSVPGAGDD